MVLAALLLLVWTAQGISLGHIHYMPGEATPATTTYTTITGENGQVIRKSHRDGIRDDNCPLCKLSVHMAILVVPQHIVLAIVRLPLPRIAPVMPRAVDFSPRSHHWSGRAPPR